MLELTNLESSKAELNKQDCSKIKGGAVGLPALASAAATTGAFNDVPSLPSARSFLSNAGFAAALGAAGVAGTLASGGTLSLLQAGLSLEG